MNKSKKVISKYKKKSNGKLDSNNPIYVDYDKEKKIKYYEKRINDKSLTEKQREYARIKHKMLTSGKGVIAIENDEDFKGGKGKIRRVMITGVDKKTGEKAVNRITTSTNEENEKLTRQNVPILQKESRIEQKIYVKKKKGESITDKDLKETSSTINPFDYKRIFKFIFKGRHNDNKSNAVAKNNTKIGKKYK